MVPNSDFLLKLHKFSLFKVQLKKGTLQDEDTVLNCLVGGKICSS